MYGEYLLYIYAIKCIYNEKNPHKYFAILKIVHIFAV